MPTNVPGTTARQYHQQQVHYIRRTVNFNDPGIAGGVPIGILPAGATIIDAQVVVTTAFNAATTNNLLVGTTAGGNDIIATGDSAAGTTGLKRLASATIGVNAVRAADTTLFAAYTQSGTAATAGRAVICIEFVPNLDN